MSQSAKFNGVQNELLERSASGSLAILLIAHFKDTLAQLDGIEAKYHANTPVLAMLAEKLSADIANKLPLDETASVDLIVAERHPLLSVDKQPFQFAEELPCRCRVAHHISLDDPILKMFAGDWVKECLTRLGMMENEPIESNMVRRRIKAAQKKIESKAFGNAKAQSAAEWIENNT